MADEKKLKEEIAVNKDFDLLTKSYQEHATGQINFARFSVLYARSYAQDLAEVFANVKTSYLRGVIKKNIKSVVKKNGKDIWILLSANNKLYGDIVLRTTNLFISKVKDVDAKKADIAVIGRQGKEIIDRVHFTKNYEYYEIPDTSVTSDFLKKISEKLVYYENIYVFYSRFENLVSQKPVQVALTGEIPDIEVQSREKKNQQSFLFEPTLEEIISFFENQILSLLFNQTVQESQLARFASRISAMENAQNNIQKELDRLKHLGKIERLRKINKKQTELLVGRSLWNKL